MDNDCYLGGNYLKKANTFRGNGQLEEAANTLRSAIKENPNFYLYHHNLGETLAKLGDLDGAIAAYRGAIALKPDYVWSVYSLGKLLINQGKLEEAMLTLQKAVAIYPSSAFYGSLGIVLMKLKRVDEATDCFQKALDIHPLWVEAYLHLGRLKSEKKLWSEAVVLYRQAVEFCANGDAYFGMARALVEMGQLEEAVTNYRLGTGLSSDVAEVYSDLGMTLEKLGRWEEAAMEYQKARKISPNSIEVHLKLGEVLQKLGKVSEAESCYRRCLQIEPQQVEALTKLEALSSLQAQVSTKSEEDKKTKVSLALGIEDDSIQVQTLQTKAKNLQAKYEHLQCQHDLIQKELASVSKNYRSMRKIVDRLNLQKEQLERKIKKQASDFNCKNTLLESSVSNILSWRYGAMTPGIKDWEKKWDNNPGKRILYFTPVDYSGSFYKWATAVNKFTEYAVRLVTLQFHEFGYTQDLVLPMSHQCEQSLRLMVGEADVIHIKDELGFFEEGKARNELPLDIFTASGKPLVYTLYGGKARRFCHDYYYRDHINSFDVAVAMTPDLAYPWIELCYFVPHSVDVEAYPYDWGDGKTISHSPSSPSRKGTELFLQAIEKLDPSLQIKLNLIQGVSHAECIARKRKSTLFFDQAGWQKSNYPGKHLTIGWYGNSALEAMVHGIPTIAHLDNAALDNAARLGADMRKKCPVINVPMIYGNGGVEDMIEKIERFFRLSKDERKELSLKTRKWVEEFHSYEVNSQQLAEIYGRLLNSAPIKNTALSCSIQ